MKFPKPGELVIGIVKKINPYGAIVVLTEYNNLESFLHISEVASKWIKNIHKFLHDGQRVVVKVLRVDPSKSQVDVSLRQVSEEEKKLKLQSVKQKARVINLIKFALKTAKSRMSPEKIYSKLEEVGEPYYVLEDILDDEHAIDDIDIPDKIRSALIEVVKKSMKKSYVKVSAEIKLICNPPRGIEDIKKILSSIRNADILYLGAPYYKIIVDDEDYKHANKKLRKILEGLKIPKHCSLEYDLRK